MRYRVVLRYLGLVLIGTGLLMSFPLLWSLYYHERDTIPFLLSIGVTTATGIILTLLTLKSGKKITTREALAFVTGAWLLASAFSALPYMLTGTFHNYLNAYFEALAGYTTTAATMFVNIEGQTHAILMWRAMTQWVGGMGIIAVFVIIFPTLGIGPAHLVEAAQPGTPMERLTARKRDTFRALWRVYAGLSLLEVLLLLVARMPLFDAIATTFGTMSTGGFTVRNMSIGAYNSPAIEIIIIFFMIMAAVNFGIIYSLVWKRNFNRLLHDVEFRVFLGIMLLASLLISGDLFLHAGLSAGTALRQGFFQAVSFQTTTGYFTANYSVWPALSQAIIIILMLIGGSSGSTAGALKVFRVVVLGKYGYRELLHVFSPRATLSVKFGERTLPEWVLSRIVGLGILYIITFVISFLFMSAAGLDLVTAASSVASAMGTVGPALGALGPGASFLPLPAFAKIVLMADMLIGRLELWTILALLSPAFWRWR
jgi:trk system potassium uptake protein TrkH